MVYRLLATVAAIPILTVAAPAVLSFWLSVIDPTLVVAAALIGNFSPS